MLSGSRRSAAHPSGPNPLRLILLTANLMGRKMEGVALCLTPHGRLVIVSDSGAQPLDTGLAERLQEAFARGSGHGLLLLGVDEAGTTLPPVFTWWREFGARYVTALCARWEGDAAEHKFGSRPLRCEELEEIALSAPPLTGAEYLTAAVLALVMAGT